MKHEKGRRRNPSFSLSLLSIPSVSALIVYVHSYCLSLAPTHVHRGPCMSGLCLFPLPPLSHTLSLPPFLSSSPSLSVFISFSISSIQIMTSAAAAVPIVSLLFTALSAPAATTTSAVVLCSFHLLPSLIYSLTCTYIPSLPPFSSLAPLLQVPFPSSLIYFLQTPPYPLIDHQDGPLILLQYPEERLQLPLHLLLLPRRRRELLVHVL